MAAGPLTAEERHALVGRVLDHKRQRFAKPGQPRVSQDDHYRHTDAYLAGVGEYFDRLPRKVLSACPFCGASLKRAFDPWGVDGPWWGVTAICQYDEPTPCEHFRVLLGALRLDDSPLPSAMFMKVQPGPEVPFVVPRLLGLPNMIAVVAGLPLPSVGAAYPIAYFSDVGIDPGALHQPWCRNVHWFERDGKEAWNYCNDPWDFDLEPHVESGQLCWMLQGEDDEEPQLLSSADGLVCPFVGLTGEQRPQVITDGARSFMSPPDGTPPNPFDE